MKVIFLDREGTLIVDPPGDRVDNEEKVRLLPKTIDGLSILAGNGYAAVILTNQTNIAQGRVTEAGFWKIHHKVLSLLQPSGIKVIKTYVCPHNADDGCDCRKPMPGMLLAALKDLKLRPQDVYMIGDRESDIDAGHRAGTKTILVKTGKWNTIGQHADFIASDLLEAAHYIVTN